MEAIIMAGGKGARMRPLTLQTPKPLLELQNQPILAWSLMSLPDIVDRVLIVVSYLKEQIERFMARQTLYADYAIVEQLPAPLGTGHALQCCQTHLRRDDFLVINGDDLYARDALHRLAQCDIGILSILREDFDNFGVIVTDADGHFQRIDEKPPRDRYQPPAPCSIGAYKFTSDVFNYELPQTGRGEYEISDYASLLAGEGPVTVVDSPFWLPIGDPAALKAAQSVDLRRWIG